MRWQFESIPVPSTFVEGPAWSGRSLFFSDLPGERILRLDSHLLTVSVVVTHSRVARGLAFDREGSLWACEGSDGASCADQVAGVVSGLAPCRTSTEGPTPSEGRGVVRYDLAARRNTVTSRHACRRFDEPQDIIIDRAGRAWFTDSRFTEDGRRYEQPGSAIHRLDRGKRETARVAVDVGRACGLALSIDERTLYVTDAGVFGQASAVRAYTIGADGALSVGRTLREFGPERVGGLALDAFGRLLVVVGRSHVGAGPRIEVLDGDGARLQIHALPATATNVCFGDTDLRTVYVTGFDGRLHRARVDRHGAPLVHGVRDVEPVIRPPLRCERVDRDARDARDAGDGRELR